MLENATVGHLGWIGVPRELLTTFAMTLIHDDHVVVERGRRGRPKNPAGQATCRSKATFYFPTGERLAGNSPYLLDLEPRTPFM